MESRRVFHFQLLETPRVLRGISFQHEIRVFVLNLVPLTQTTRAKERPPMISIPPSLCSTVRVVAFPFVLKNLRKHSRLPALCGVLALVLGGAWVGVHAQAGDFGTVNVGSTSPTSIPMTLTFGTAETLGSIAVVTQGATGLDFTNAGGGSCAVGTAYAAGITCTVNVSFTPKFAGTRYGAAKLLDGSGNVIATGYVQGTGVGPQVTFLPGNQSVIADYATNGLDTPVGVAVDGSGNFYISDGNIASIGGSGVLKETLSPDGYIQSVVASAANNGPGSPEGIAVDGSGNVYIADDTFGNGQVFKETLTAGGYTQSVVANAADNGLVSPESVAVDGSGNVYIADIDYDNGKVLKETLSAGGYTQSVVASAAGNGLSFPYGVAVDGSGNVYITDFGNSRLLKETLSAGGYAQSVVANAATNGLNEPDEVAVDGNGNVYIADWDNFRVLKETLSAGSYTQTVIANAATNGLEKPYGVAVDGSGNVYIADTVNSRVLKEGLADAPSLTFVQTAIGATSTDSPKTVTVNNDGNAALLFPLPAGDDNPSVPANFDWDPSSSCVHTTPSSSAAFELAGGTSCTMAFDLKPTMTGSISGIAELTDNNLNAAAPGYATQSIAMNMSEPGDLILTVSPASLDVVRGASSTSTINMNGYTGSVSLAVSGLPANVAASFSPNPATGSSVLKLTAGSTAAGGTYNLSITGSSGTQETAAALDLTVNSAPSFALLVSPASLTVFEDAYAASTVTVLPIKPFAGNVNLAVSGLPTGISASFGPNPAIGSSVLTLTATSFAAVGVYNLTITGTSTTGTETLPASLALQVAAQSFTPPSGTFGAVKLGATGQAQSLTYTFVNATTLGSTAVLTQGAAGLDFADAGTGTCKAGTAYIAGNTCTVKVNFTPKFAGTRYGVAELLDGSENVLATGYLQGTGVGPQMSFLPATQSLVFAAANIGQGEDDELAVAVDGSGNVYIGDQGNNQVVKETLSAGGYTQSIITSNVSYPYSVAVDGSGNVYVADGYNGQVLKETPSAGGYAETVVANSANNGLQKPWAVAVDWSGNLYIADVHFDSATDAYSSRLLKETLSAGSYTQSVVVSSADNSTYSFVGVAVDGSGNLYIADGYNDQVLKETPSAAGYTESVVANSASVGLNGPAGIAVDGLGNVFVTTGTDDPYSGLNNSEVLKETPSAGGYTQSVVVGGPGNDLGEPIGIAVDGGGNLYVSSYLGSQVLKEDLADPPSVTFAPTAVSSTSTDSPETVTVSNVGNATLIFPLPATEENPSVSVNFAWDPSSTCKQTTAGSSAASELAGGANCTMAFDFKPTKSGSIAGSAELTDNNLNAADAVQQIQLNGIGQAPQAITFPQPASPVYYGVAPITLSATGGASGNPVLFSIVSGPGSISATNNTVLNITGWGTIVIAANQAGNYEYTAAPQVTQSIMVLFAKPAALTAPVLGSVLASSSATFTWSPGVGATDYMLYLGSTGVRSNNLYDSRPTAATSVNVNGLPVNGEAIYARLYSFIGGAWESLDYTYAAASQATLTSPAPSSTLTGSSVAFTWSAGTGVSMYYLLLGSDGVGSSNLYNSGYTFHKSVNVTGLPVNGETIYARLYSQLGGAWHYLDYSYTAQ